MKLLKFDASGLIQLLLGRGDTSTASGDAVLLKVVLQLARKAR